jgi:hypothetical protein
MGLGLSGFRQADNLLRLAATTRRIKAFLFVDEIFTLRGCCSFAAVDVPWPFFVWIFQGGISHET